MLGGVHQPYRKASVMSHPSTSTRANKRTFALVLAAMIPLAAAGIGGVAAASGSAASGTAANGAGDLGPRSGLLARDHLTVESALQVDLSKESVRLPLYKGDAHGQTVWFALLDASDAGLAHDLGINYAPKLANIGIGCPECVQTVTLDAPDSAAEQVRAGHCPLPREPPTSARPASPSRGRTASPSPSSNPAPSPDPATARSSRSRAHLTVYSAPIVATGDGPFDVDHHTNTGDRVLDVHIAAPSQPGQFAESWVDMLFVKGFDAGQPIVYISTDAGQPLTAVLERSTYVPALDKAAYNGGDDFLGSARERLFAFINGQTGADNKQAQGFVHLAKDGHVAEDASAKNTAFIDALRNGGDLLNVFGDFPTQDDPRHAQAYSPLWDAQLGLWTNKAVQQGLNERQIDEVQVFNLAATRPDLLTGIDPATGQPAPYGSVGVDINCAVLGFINKAPNNNLAEPVPNSQFPPR